ncbi:Ig-like domain repeat protein [Streptomyces sp. Go40/10]|uniref:Ig-like domain repeat protein n=1 Tax=Streptomyces sp. Go40/10 TaxID=2825844 RepID=UPI001E553A41|nr:Ig-like domain repeat protein [Streptomyces sp. Go40/10]UFR03612.1 Ig-like domain repeat protein [Streptomyces sp. Go40/10]
MRKRSLTAATTLAVLFSSAALAATPASADSTTALPVRTIGDIVVDAAHQQVFISDPLNGKIVVTDLNGKPLKEITTNLSGVNGLELSADSGTLYAAVQDLDAVAVFDTATDTETARYEVGDKPLSVALAGGKLWFGYGGAAEGNIGSVDLAAEDHKVTLGQDNGWYAAPLLDAAPGSSTLIAGAVGQSPVELASYDVSSGTAAKVASTREAGSNLGDLQVTPDGKDVVVASGAPYYQQVFRTSDLNEDGKYVTDAYPNSVAIAPDGTVAAGIDGSYEPDVYIFKPGSSEAVRAYDFPNTGTSSGSDLLARGGLAWAPDASRLFAVTSNSQGVYSLRVLDAPTKAAATVTVDAPATATRAKPLTVKGKVASKAAVPAGTKLAVTRTDMESPKGKALAAAVTKADGTFSFTDTPPSGGKVKYTVAYAGDAGHAAASGSDTVEVSRAKPTLTIDNNGKVYSYGKDVKFTAHLGKTYTNRTVEIWADPFGGDKPNKLVKSGKVNSDGNLSVTLDLKRDTKVTAKFKGDSRYTSASAASTVGARVSVSTSVSNHYKSKYTWNHTYYFFHKTKNPLITTKMPYYPGRAQKFEFEVYYQGRWYPGDPAYFKLGSDGVSRVTITGDHGEDVGWRFRVRSSYINSASGDTVNSTTHGAWKYFTFTR